jgi:hypothetical protein
MGDCESRGVGAAPNQWDASCLGKASVSALRGWLPAVVLRGDIGHDAAYRSSREEQA